MNKVVSHLRQIRQSGLARTIISYLCVFLLPFLVVSGIWYQTSTESINQQAKLSSRNHLLQLKASFENNLLQLNDYSHQIPHDTRLSYKKMSHPYFSLEGQQSLQKQR